MNQGSWITKGRIPEPNIWRKLDRLMKQNNRSKKKEGKKNI